MAGDERWVASATLTPTGRRVMRVIGDASQAVLVDLQPCHRARVTLSIASSGEAGSGA